MDQGMIEAVEYTQVASREKGTGPQADTRERG